jgi:CBS domain-containing protein
MRIREIMSSPAVVVPPELPVKEAAAVLDARGFTCLPVVGRDGRLVGIVREEELVAERFPPDPRIPIADRADVRAGTTIGDVMRCDVLVAHGADLVTDLLTVLRSAELRSLPVVDDGVVVGVVTYRDLLRALARDDSLIGADVQRRLDIYGGPGRWRASVVDGEVTIGDERRDVAARSGAIRVAESVIGVTRCRVVDAVPSEMPSRSVGDAASL